MWFVMFEISISFVTLKFIYSLKDLFVEIYRYIRLSVLIDYIYKLLLI